MDDQYQGMHEQYQGMDEQCQAVGEEHKAGDDRKERKEGRLEEEAAGSLRERLREKEAAMEGLLAKLQEAEKQLRCLRQRDSHSAATVPGQDKTQMDSKDIEIERLTAELLFKEEEMDQVRKQREEEEQRRQAAEAEARALKEKMAKGGTEREPRVQEDRVEILEQPNGKDVNAGNTEEPRRSAAAASGAAAAGSGGGGGSGVAAAACGGGGVSMGGGSENRQEEQRLERRGGEGKQASGRKQGNDDMALMEADRDDAGADSAHDHSESARRFDESRSMMRDSAEHSRFVASQLIAHCPQDFLSLVATPPAAHFPPALGATPVATHLFNTPTEKPTRVEHRPIASGSGPLQVLHCRTPPHAQTHSLGTARLLFSADEARGSAVSLGRRGGEEDVRSGGVGGDAMCANVQQQLQIGFSNLLIGIDSPHHFFSTLLDFACSPVILSQPSRLQAKRIGEGAQEGRSDQAAQVRVPPVRQGVLTERRSLVHGEGGEGGEFETDTGEQQGMWVREWRLVMAAAFPTSVATEWTDLTVETLRRKLLTEADAAAAAAAQAAAEAAAPAAAGVAAGSIIASALAAIQILVASSASLTDRHVSFSHLLPRLLTLLAAWEAGRVKGDNNERVRVVGVVMKLILLLLLPLPSHFLDKHILLQSPNSGTVSDDEHSAVTSAAAFAGLLLDVLCSLLQATATMQVHRRTQALSMQTRTVSGGFSHREASYKGDRGGLARGFKAACEGERRALRRLKGFGTSLRGVGEGYGCACGVIEVLGLLCGWAAGKGMEEGSGFSGEEGRSGSRGSECGRKEGEETGGLQRVKQEEQRRMLEQGEGIGQDTAGRVRAGGGVTAGVQVEGMDVEGGSALAATARVREVVEGVGMDTAGLEGVGVDPAHVQVVGGLKERDGKLAASKGVNELVSLSCAEGAGWELAATKGVSRGELSLSCAEGAGWGAGDEQEGTRGELSLSWSGRSAWQQREGKEEENALLLLERDEEQHVATAGGRRITLLVLERAEEERRQHLERAGEVPRGELSLSLAEGAGLGADGEQGGDGMLRRQAPARRAVAHQDPPWRGLTGGRRVLGGLAGGRGVLGGLAGGRGVLGGLAGGRGVLGGLAGGRGVLGGLAGGRGVLGGLAGGRGVLGGLAGGRGVLGGLAGGRGVLGGLAGGRGVLGGLAGGRGVLGGLAGGRGVLGGLAGGRGVLGGLAGGRGVLGGLAGGRGVLGGLAGGRGVLGGLAGGRGVLGGLAGGRGVLGGLAGGRGVLGGLAGGRGVLGGLAGGRGVLGGLAGGRGVLGGLAGGRGVLGGLAGGRGVLGGLAGGSGGGRDVRRFKSWDLWVGAPAVPRQLRRQASARRAVAHQGPPRRGLTATSMGGAWDCYFFPIVNPDCERVVSDMIANNTMPSLSLRTSTGGAWGCYFFPIVNPDSTKTGGAWGCYFFPIVNPDWHNPLAASADPPTCSPAPPPLPPFPATSTGGAWGCYFFPVVNPDSTGTGGAWGCYFFHIVNPDCERVVSDMTASSTMPALSSDKTGHNRLAASADPPPCSPHPHAPPFPFPATGTGGAWGCYFFPVVNPDCERVVSDMIASSTMPPMSSDKTGHNRLAASADPVVHLNSSCDSQMKFEARAAKLWGDAYARAPNVVEYMGAQPPVEDKHPMVHWWRSQSTRFMLRWSSPHTCHQINKERHTAYGLHTASHLSHYTEIQSEILRAVAGNTQIIAGNASETPESKKLFEISAGPPGPIEAQVWSVRGFAGCNETCMGAANVKAIRETYAAVGGEPFVMRPIVSVRVRQSDKGTEMRLSPLATHMFFVHRLRRHVPDLRYVWLNTEMESVVKESALYADWKFLYSSNSRQPVDSRTSRVYELTQSVAASFASVIIASQCDYFVGALGSNWSRLINELRSTNGRLLSGFYTVNMGDW
ncbi:unnamed protein product [Closterium sp. Naga37s-1]|nr:unnamed protein product [Closterium sp. Naga37s-1]